MTKDYARDILWNYLKYKIQDKKELPIWDESVTTTYENNILATWTFRGLVKFIYDLEDKHLENLN